jgi:hypothetical protein
MVVWGCARPESGGQAAGTIIGLSLQANGIEYALREDDDLIIKFMDKPLIGGSFAPV